MVLLALVGEIGSLSHCAELLTTVNILEVSRLSVELGLLALRDSDHYRRHDLSSDR